MTNNIENTHFHFLEDQSIESGDEFLKKRLAYLLDRFSYERLSKCSTEEIHYQKKIYAKHRVRLDRNFINPDFIFSDNIGMFEQIIGEEIDMYDPLTPEQRHQITDTYNKIDMNFDAALEEAKERKLNRWSKLAGLLPSLK